MFLSWRTTSEDEGPAAIAELSRRLRILAEGIHGCLELLLPDPVDWEEFSKLDVENMAETLLSAVAKVTAEFQAQPTDHHWLVDTSDDQGQWVGRAYLPTHSPSECRGKVCVVHNPTDHPMAEWPKMWRKDTQSLVRFCAHGKQHPDPDQAHLWAETRVEGFGHDCCGCCIQALVGAIGAMEEKK